MSLPRRLAPLSVTLAALVAVLLPTGPASAATTSTAFARWTSTADFGAGTSVGIAAQPGKITQGAGTSIVTYDDPRISGGAKSYRSGYWTSPWQSTGFSATSLIPSWNATAPKGSWIRVLVRVRSGSTIGSWDNVARWAASTTHVKRASDSTQSDDLARLSTDTIVANSGRSFSGWQVRVQLMRPGGTMDMPTVYAIGGVAASYTTRSASTSATTMTSTKELAVPRYSQMIHRGEYPQWGGGGEAWCSPTSTAMVMRYFDAGPSKSSYSWSPYADSVVDHAARETFDHAYDGTGNWPFNTAYAGRYSLDAFVTRLHSLRDAEAFIKAGIPLVASVAFGRGGLDGAPISSTPGHLMVIRGFTSGGSVIANDPAGSANSNVRRVYQRAQFEKAWLGGSGGVVYVIRPFDRALPADTARW